MTVMLASVAELNALCGRDRSGRAVPVSQERRVERDVRDRLQDLEQMMRRCEAEMIEVLIEAEDSLSFTLDGHRAVRGWAAAAARWSEAELRDRVRTVRLVRDVPEILGELWAGCIGVAQVREIARLRANPRCRDQDGAHKGHEAAHAGRRVAMAEMDGTFHLAGQWGVVQGSAIVEVLARFERAEFDADWDALRARVGEAAAVSMLERSATQRRADAMYQIFLAAAASPPDGQRPEPVVNIVVDQATFEEHVAAVAARTTVPPPDPNDLARRCETVAGVPVDPAVAVAAAVVGYLRRVVMNAQRVVIDMGRSQRLYRGSARTAALLQGLRCTWPGCGRDTRITIDHIDEWHNHGPTDQANANRACTRHNQFKTTGYRVWRDEHGRWHTYRPDGTEIRAI